MGNYDEKVIEFCEKNNLDPDDLDLDIIDAIEAGAGVGFCILCNGPTVIGGSHICPKKN